MGHRPWPLAGVLCKLSGSLIATTRSHCLAGRSSGLIMPSPTWLVGRLDSLCGRPRPGQSSVRCFRRPMAACELGLSLGFSIATVTESSTSASKSGIERIARGLPADSLRDPRLAARLRLGTMAGAGEALRSFIFDSRASASLGMGGASLPHRARPRVLHRISLESMIGAMVDVTCLVPS